MITLALLIPITFIFVYGIVAITKTLLRHRERMAMIERGMNPHFPPDPVHQQEPGNPQRTPVEEANDSQHRRYLVGLRADCIRVYGARTHNLQNVDIALPRDRLVVLTGPSGSGKSSLAFDTIYAEGQRQYIESLSPYARQFLHQLERPDVDLIEGLEPTISIDQRAGSHNPRSTVATVTEIYDYLRLLFARLGESSCHQCGMAIRPQSPEQIIETILAQPPGTRMMILAPIVRGRKGQHREALEEIRKAGFVRARIDGELLEVNEPPELSPRKAHTIEAVVDRIVIREGVEPRLAESVRLALRHGDGLMLASYEEAGTKRAGPWRDEFSARSTPARTAASVLKKSNRGRSVSTALTALAPSAKGWA